jgi:type I restriction enzyme, S subunit
VSRYQAYPEYKDSGVEWLGEIPAHWATSKIRYMFSFDKGLTITKENLLDEGVPCVNYGEVHSKYGFEVDPSINPLKCVEEQYLKSSKNSLLLKGDLVFADTSEDIDGSGNFTQLVSDQIVFAGYHTIIVRPNDRQNYRFYAYLFDSKELRTQIRHAVKGVKVFSVTQAILRAVNIWLPSLDERIKIANFLDHETAKIDTLIEKQQQLIQLLKEKRQAVISHAVTKGLNPNAPMKDSGVEWLGEVPEHWGVLTVRNLIRAGKLEIQDGNHGEQHPVAAEYEEDGIPFLMANNVQAGKIDFKNCKFLSLKRANDLRIGFAKANDILLTHKGTVGEVGLIPESIDTPYCMLTPQVTYYRWKICNNYFNKYFYIQMQSTFFQVQLDVIGGKQSTRAYVGLVAQGDLWLLVPPKKEQVEIYSYVESKVNKIENLISKAEQGIDFIKERRTALISAAVTGKIDVRNWQAPQN